VAGWLGGQGREAGGGREGERGTRVVSPPRSMYRPNTTSQFSWQGRSCLFLSLTYAHIALITYLRSGLGHRANNAPDLMRKSRNIHHPGTYVVHGPRGCAYVLSVVLVLQ
jgi:hypothetical protein